MPFGRSRFKVQKTKIATVPITGTVAISMMEES
jgi:hypothetical protein